MPPKTPPPKPPTTLETPVFVRSTSGHCSYDATLEASRKAVMEDLHRIPVVKIDDMMAAMFPHVDSTLARAVVEKLKSQGHINARRRWQAFDVEPSKQMGSEDNVYNTGLLDTFNQIINATKDLGSNILVPMALKVSGSKTPQSERTNTSRPDGYFHLQSSTLPLEDYRALKLGPDQTHWADIVCPMEFKKDMWKIVWSMHEIMRSDPLRRFALGITIENTTLRFWISHRAYVVASTPIDINSAGYDPTMSRVSSRNGDGKYCYDIAVRDPSGKERIFRTKDEIATYGADAVRGRGTRVWSAYDKTDDPNATTLFALKDTWVNIDRPREGDTLRTLRRRLAEKKEVDALQHFLTEVIGGDVHVGNTPDNTGTCVQNGRLFTVNSILETRVAYDGVGTVKDIEVARSGSKRSASSMGNVPNIKLSSAEGTLQIGKVLDEHRVHYRIVFEEIGTPIHKLGTFYDIFLALRDAVVALKAMFSVQHIHRDVSCSNILLFRAPGKRARGLLVDLEYAKDITIMTTPHEFRTGTRDFMAVEVRESDYLFRPPDARVPVSALKELPPFQHNCLHDLESTWWIALWTIYVFAPIAPSEQDIIHFHQLFPPRHILAPRTSGLGPSLIQTARVAKMRPEQNQLIFETVHDWRYDLYIAYTNLEKNRFDEGKLDESVFKYVHDEALRNLDALLAALEKDDLGTLKLVHMQFSGPSKGKKARRD